MPRPPKELPERGLFMKYCEKCMLTTENDSCPKCGSQKLREPKDNDPVFLMIREAIWSGGIEETLKENGIPCLKKGLHGAAVTERTGGYLNESYMFYVPYGALQKSKELLDLND